MDMPSTHEPPRHLARRRLMLMLGASLVGAAGFAVAIATAGGGSDKAPAGPAGSAAAAAALSVETVSPQPLTLARTVAASGSVSARDELLIGSDAGGVRLTQVLVEVGAMVRRGQLLARGDDSALRAQWAQHAAMVRQAEVEWSQASANLDRAEGIKDSGVYSVEAVQTRRTAVEAAAARLDLARAQVRELEVQLARTQVLAPADGVIARRTATVGVVMQPGVELFRLMRDGELEWLAELPAASLARVRPGAAAQVRLDDGQVVQARVRLVAPTIDPHTRNGLVHVSLPREAAGTVLRAGGHVSGEIVVGQADALTLPESVVFARDGESFVYVLGEGDVARRQRIVTGIRQRGLVEVQGLKPDARVVSTGSGFVKDGERLRVVARSSRSTANPGAAS